MSDGTAEIRVLDPATLAEKRRFTVHDGHTAVNELNELEFVEGELFANVWQTDRIARISPRNGEVVGWIDLKGLLSPVYRMQSGAVLNGIAYDSQHKRLFVTGKLWPDIFEIHSFRNPSTGPRMRARESLEVASSLISKRVESARAIAASKDFIPRRTIHGCGKPKS